MDLLATAIPEPGRLIQVGPHGTVPPGPLAHLNRAGGQGNWIGIARPLSSNLTVFYLFGALQLCENQKELSATVAI